MKWLLLRGRPHASSRAECRNPAVRGTWEGRQHGQHQALACIIILTWQRRKSVLKSQEYENACAALKLQHTLML